LLNRIYHRYFLLLILFIPIFLSEKTSGQTLQEPLITDRPDQAESAETILPGFFQVETGFLFNKNTTNTNFEIKSYDYATTLLRVGLAKDVELRIESSLLSQEFKSLNNKSTTTGISGLNVGAKIRLVKNSNSIPNISAIFNLKLPVGEVTFRPKNAEPEFVLIVSKDLSDIVTYSANIATERNSEEDIFNFFYSLSFGISLSDKFGTFMEYYGSSSSFASAANKFDTGLTYLIKDNFQLDISGGLDFKTGTSDWFVSTGFSFRLPN